jgi:penicillin-binding protein 1C
MQIHNRFIRILLRSTLCAAAAAGCFFLVIRFSPYPAYREFLTRKVSTRVYDRSGSLIQIVSLDDGLRREYLPLDSMPHEAVRIFMEAEDRRFYSHHGIDTGAVFRAFVQNVQERRTVSGASTITMQLARIIRPARSRNIAVKIRESFDALRLESRCPKDRILELYLNNVPFGFNSEGVATASRTFFGTTLDRLTEAQLYCLAVIPRRPLLYNPLANPGQCAAAAYELYCSTGTENKTVRLTKQDFRNAADSARSFTYPYSMPHYIRWLSGRNESGMFTQSELHISASLEIQRKAEDLLSSYVADYAGNRVTNGAVIVCDTRTGGIIAWVGSTDFFDSEHSGQIDGVITPEQPGSSMKPFLYALALERGFTPASVLPDVPSEFGFDQLYVPQNFNNRYNGPVRLRVALASSLNVPAVYLLNTLGMNAYTDKLRDLDFKSLEHSDAGLGLALGNGAVTVFELVQAFSIFPRDGIFIPLNAGSADERNGSLKTASGARRVYESDTARLICDMLSDADARATGFGYAKTFITPFPSMFKTGTANQFQNITALGATPLYTAGVWMGNFSGDTVIGKTGSSIPAKIVRELLLTLQGNKVVEFKKPVQYRKERICQLSGMKAGPYCPDTVDEYVPAGRSGGVCTWHSSAGTAYPAEYEQWFKLKKRNGTLAGNSAPFTIQSPRDGSVFFYDQSNSARNQNLIIEAAGGSCDTAVVTVDGDTESSFTVTRPFTCSIPIERGVHVVTMYCGDETAGVSFTVK